MSHNAQTRLAVLRKHIDAWIKKSKKSRTTIGAEIAELCIDMGICASCEKIGVKFRSGGDAFEKTRVNSQKLFRWLGYYDGVNASPERVLYIEQAIVAAMPADIRLAYLNEVFACTGVFVGVGQTDNASTGNMAAALTKENTEAQLAVIHLSEKSTDREAKEAMRELRESAGTTLAAIDRLEEQYPNLKNNRTPSDVFRGQSKRAASNAVKNNTTGAQHA